MFRENERLWSRHAGLVDPIGFMRLICESVMDTVDSNSIAGTSAKGMIDIDVRDMIDVVT